MKKVIVSLLCVGLISTSFAQGLKTPSASTSQTVKQEFSLSNVELVYARPNVKSRNIFGDLVPFGKPWRTGANGATKITFGEDVTVGGVAVKAGSYALYTVPNKTEWTIILNKGIGNWGVGGYTETDNVASFTVVPTKLKQKTESFSIDFSDIFATKMNINIAWDKTKVSIPVVAENDGVIMANIDKAMETDKKPYFAAANYYLENGKDLNKALNWINKAVEENPKAYWVMLAKAKIQGKLGDVAGALATSNLSKTTAAAEGNPDYVTLNEKFQAGLKK